MNSSLACCGLLRGSTFSVCDGCDVVHGIYVVLISCTVIRHDQRDRVRPAVLVSHVRVLAFTKLPNKVQLDLHVRTQRIVRHVKLKRARYDEGYSKLVTTRSFCCHIPLYLCQWTHLVLVHTLFK